MKIANIVTNAVLAAAVVVLFILHFAGGRETVAEDGHGVKRDSIAMADISIAYFNMDSVMARWDLYFDYQQELQKRQTDMETEFSGRTEKYYQNVQDAQYKVQRGLVTRSEAEQLQQQLADEQQNLMNLQNQYTSQLQEEGLVKNRKLLDMIERYVRELSEQNGYAYVYSYSFGGNLIYGAEPFDITDDVVKGLNERFKPGTDID
jgi:outer membrane protein